MLFVIAKGTKIPKGSEAYICELGSNVPYAYMCNGCIDELMDAPVLPFMAADYPQVLGLSLLNLTCDPASADMNSVWVELDEVTVA